MKIILASNNGAKLAEIRAMLCPLGFEIIPQAQMGADIEVEETGKTFAENAYLKAKAVYDLTGYPVISDDSGLEVNALGGKPGIYSARYAPPGKRCEKVLAEMSGVPEYGRGADFVCCICFINKDGTAKFFHGKCYGKIAKEKRGEGGFGYDPIFLYNGMTFAEMPSEEKNTISHRAKALDGLKKYLEGLS